MNIVYKETKDFTEQEVEELFLSVKWLSGKYPERLIKALKSSSLVVTAWDGTQLVGLIRALDDGEMVAFLHYLLVHPDYQGEWYCRKAPRYCKGEIQRLPLPQHHAG
ncbi:GNAT family N-acetyltransferase [Bacteroides faecis]|nr:GNAT family N-acetyltransferase [Bacteroides faecis]UVQ60107.1 GNAT family N-acetyltransferase [Bacteroides faecis]